MLTEEQSNLNNTMKKSKMKLHIPLPVIQATDTVKAYLATLSEDEKKELKSNYDIALKAGAAERIGLLVQTFYHIHTIQTFLQGDIEILLDNWGLRLKVRTANVARCSSSTAEPTNGTTARWNSNLTKRRKKNEHRMR